MKLKLKLDEHGNVVVKDGMPVYVYADGKEAPFDVVGTVDRVNKLTADIQSANEAKSAAESAIAKFKGIDDPAAALKAIETLRNIDDKKLVDAGKVDEVRAAATRTMEERLRAAESAHGDALKALTGERDLLRTRLENELIGGAFQRSKFIAESMAIPADLVQARFGSQFKIEDGQLVAYNKKGERVYSRTRAGDPNVPFDEALETMVNEYEYRDSIMKGSGSSGSGSHQSGSGGPAPTNKTAKEMSIEEKAAFIGKHGLEKWTAKVSVENAA